MKLKKNVRKVLNLLLVYVISGVIIFSMSQRIERLNEQERLERNTNIIENIDK